MNTGENPDRSAYYQDSSPGSLLKHLNAAWKQIRTIEKAVGDRDKALDKLHHSISERDATIENLRTALRIHNRAWPLLYAILGGAAAKFGDMAILWLTKGK